MGCPSLVTSALSILPEYAPRVGVPPALPLASIPSLRALSLSTCVRLDGLSTCVRLDGLFGQGGGLAEGRGY